MTGLVINAVHQIVSRRVNPIESGVITIGSIHGGKASNVIPESVEMTGTIRSYTPEIRRLLHEELQKAVNIVEAMGGTISATDTPGGGLTVVVDLAAAGKDRV